MSNADKLREYMRMYGLTYQKVADTMGVSLSTVKSWLIHSGSEKYRAMPDRMIKLLHLSLLRKKKVRK